jgi:GNAT superfamily N-acetyltransferase
MVIINKIVSTDTYSVRQDVLRKGKPLETCYFNGDDDATTAHFGLFQDEIIIGVVSVYQVNNPSFMENHQFQIRGMAVLEAFQSKGYGEQLLKVAEKYCWDQKATLIWCNARENAVSFYNKLGYTIYGESFIITDVGTHFVMHK